MLQTLTNLLSRKKKKAAAQPSGSLQPVQSPIEPHQVSKGSVSVINTLQEAGYEAYLVGGCVRDLLLSLKPKDFDVATNATPEQVHRLFKRSRIVGRRFQIVHVRMGPEIIEVTTFRAHHTDDNKQVTQKDKSRQSAQGMLLRDNIFGSVEEDASRRDFTINALYYNPTDSKLYDYDSGIEDVKEHLIRMIGEPEQRYREDPVRMLRAVRFAAKLGFSIEADTAAPLRSLAPLLSNIPPARLFDEVLKLLMNGQGLTTYHLLREYGLFEQLFPATQAALDNDPGFYEPFLNQAIVNTDKRIRANKRVTPAFLWAALLWPPLKELEQQTSQGAFKTIPELQSAAEAVVHRQCQRVSIPKRFSMPMRNIWELQLRLPQRGGNRAFRLMEDKRFRASYDFLLLREDANELPPGLGEWWTQFQDVDDDARQKMVDALPKPAKKRRRRRKPRTQS